MATTAPTGDTANKTRKAKQRGVLTDKAISQAKPLEKSHKLTAGNGLYLLVNPNGSKLLRWKHRADGKEKLMALGAYPDVSLTEARAGRLGCVQGKAQGRLQGRVRSGQFFSTLGELTNNRFACGSAGVVR